MNVLAAVDGTVGDNDMKQEQHNKLRRVNVLDRRNVMTAVLTYCNTVREKGPDTVTQWCYCGTVLLYDFTYMAGIAQSV